MLQCFKICVVIAYYEQSDYNILCLTLTHKNISIGSKKYITLRLRYIHYDIQWDGNS